MPVQYLRRLPPSEPGLGEIVGAVSAPKRWDLDVWRKSRPQDFERPGFYQVLIAEVDA